MANKEKNSLIVYYDTMETLEDFTDEQVGQIFRAMIEYDKTGEEPNFTGEMKIAFKFIKKTLDLNLEKYNSTCERNRMNIQKRWNTKNTTGINGIPNDTKNTTGKSGIPKIPPYTKNTDNDTDKDNDKDIDKEIYKERKTKFVPPTKEEVIQYATSRNRLDLANKFYDYFETSNWVDSKGKKVCNWKQKFISWEGFNELKQPTLKEEKKPVREVKQETTIIDGVSYNNVFKI